MLEGPARAAGAAGDWLTEVEPTAAAPAVESQNEQPAASAAEPPPACAEAADEALGPRQVA